MRNFDQSRLEPGEIVFAMHTNSNVDASRFAAFLGAFSETVVAADVPPMTFEIVELWSGSFWGRLIGALPNPGAAERDLPSLEAAVEERRALVEAAMRSAAAQERAADAAERTAVASERMADAATASAADGAENKALQRKSLSVSQWALAVSAIGTVYTIAAGMIDDNPNPHSTRCSELMHVDGVAKIDIWTQDHHVAIPRLAVPLYRLRQQGVTGFLSALEAGNDMLTATGTVGAVSPSATEIDGGFFGADDPATVGHSDGTRFSDGTGYRSGTDAPPVPTDDAPESQRDKASRPNGEPVDMRGFVRSIGDAILFEPENSTASHPLVILIPPSEYTIGEEQRYHVVGRRYRIPGEFYLVIASQVQFIG